jgi:hypothetical protein
MRISFDLDDTLICYRPGAVHEPAPPWHRTLFSLGEPLRLGARELPRDLSAQGHEV